MSRKLRRKSGKREFPWLVVAFGGILIAAAIILLVGQGGGVDHGRPSISVDHQRIDYGDVRFNTEKSFAIRVTNTGDGTLRFKEAPYIEVLEGC